MISRFINKTGNNLHINDVVEFKGQTFLITDEETLKSLDHTNDIEYGYTDYPLKKISTYDEYLKSNTLENQ